MNSLKKSIKSTFLCGILLAGILSFGASSANAQTSTPTPRRIEIAYEDDLIIVYNSYGSSAGNFSYIYHKDTRSYTVL